MSDNDTERLCAGYRATVQDPPYDAADAALLRAAARRARRPTRLTMRRLVYGIAAALVAALGLAAGWRTLTTRPRPLPRPNVVTRTASERGHVRFASHAREGFPLLAQAARTAAGPSRANSSDYLSNAVLSSTYAGRYADPEVLLQRTSALAPMQGGATCGPGTVVDLNAAGALAAVRARRAADYGKIMRIIKGLTRHPEPDVARWISTTFHAGDVSYFPLWMTSLPPKRRLSFCLEDTRYSVVLTITPDGARLSPTDYHRNPRTRKQPPA